MSKAESTAVATLEQYAVLKADPEQIKAVIADNLGGTQVTEFDLDRVRVPAGGGRIWQIPGLDGDEDTKTVDGVIVAWREPRAYWTDGIDSTGGGTPPDCSAQDGQHGIGDPGGDCAKCPMAQFGSALKDGKQARGQACKQTRLLVMVRPDDLLPLVVVAPPSSLRAVRHYFLRLASKGVPYHGVVTRLGLAEDKNKDGIKYSVIDPQVQTRLGKEEAERMKAYAAQLAPVFAKVAVDGADVAEG